MTGLGYSISHTSRRPRNNEVNGNDYHFVDRETFNRMIDDGAFVEWAEVYSDLYGTSFSRLREQTARGSDVVMDLDSQGARNIKQHFKESILIYILPPSFEVLENRLRERATEDEKVVNTRIKKAYKELKDCTGYDYIIFNHDLHQTVEQVKSIIISERCRNSRQLPMVEKIFSIPSP